MRTEMRDQGIEVSLLNIDEQIAEAKSRAERFHQSLRDAKLLEQSYLLEHDKEKLSLEREKLQFELERQKWSKSLAEKNSIVQQLERELSSTVDALHQAMQAKVKVKVARGSNFSDNSSSSSPVAVSHMHHPRSEHHNHGHFYYDEDGRKRDDRIDGNKSHNVEHRKHAHDYSSSSGSKRDEERGLYGAWVPGGANVAPKHVISDKHVSPHRLHHHHVASHHHRQHNPHQDHHHKHHYGNSAAHDSYAHYDKEPTMDPVIPLAQQSLHKDIAEYQRENQRLKDDMKSLEDELKLLRTWRADAEGKLKFRLDQVLGCESQILMLKSQVINLTDLNKALVGTIEANEKTRKEKLKREQEISLKQLNEETMWMSPLPLERTVSGSSSISSHRKKKTTSPTAVLITKKNSPSSSASSLKKSSLSPTASSPKKATTSRLKSTKKSEEFSDQHLVDSSPDLAVETTEDLLAKAKAAFDASDNMINSKGIPQGQPTDLETMAVHIESHNETANATAFDGCELKIDASAVDDPEESSALKEAMQKVDIGEILEKVKTEAEVVESKESNNECENDERSIRSKVSEQSKTGSVLSKASKVSSSSVGGRSKVAVKPSSKRSGSGTVKPTSSTSAVPTREKGLRAVKTANTLTRRSNTAPSRAPPSSPSLATNPTSRKAPIPTVKAKQTKAVAATTKSLTARKVKSVR